MDFRTALLQLRADTRTVQEVIDQLSPRSRALGTSAG